MSVIRVLKLKVLMTCRSDAPDSTFNTISFIEEYETENVSLDASLAEATQSVYLTAQDSAMARVNCYPYQVTDLQIYVLADTQYEITGEL